MKEIKSIRFWFKNYLLKDLKSQKYEISVNLSIIMDILKNFMLLLNTMYIHKIK